MSSILVGCGGFPINQADYFRSLPAVEIRSSFERMPRFETLRRWRESAPGDFAFSLQALHPITHPPKSGGRGGAGHFRRTDEVEEAWRTTSAAAEVLGARFILFETPPSFYPNADHLRDLYAFFKQARRGERLWAWQPRGSWESELVERVCRDLKLVRAVDPLADGTRQGAVHYFRLSGAGPGRRPWRGHQYSDSELRELQSACEGRPAYVFFLNGDMWKDSRRFAALVKPGPALPPRRYLRPR